MRTKKITKRTRWSRAIIRLMTKPVLLWLLVALPLLGRACDMAIIPDSNVNLSRNIGQVLRDAGGNVNVNAALTFFTVGAKINKWARYKPVSFPKDFDITDIERGKVFYGMSIPQVNPYSIDIREKSIMSYSLPSGGQSSPLRLGDFKGYNTDCIPPFSWSIPSSIDVNALILGNCYFDRDSDLSDIPLNNVMLYDILSTYYKDWYPGVIFYCKTRNEYVWETTVTPISDQHLGGMEIKIPQYIGGNWGPGDEVYAYGILAMNEHHDNNVSGGMENGTAIYIASEDNGYRSISLIYENQMVDTITITSLTLIYHSLGQGNYIITTVEFNVINTGQIPFDKVVISGYFDNKEGATFPIRSTGNHIMPPNVETTIRLQMGVNVYTPDGIIGISLTCSSHFGYTQLLSSKYDLNTNSSIP